MSKKNKKLNKKLKQLLRQQIRENEQKFSKSESVKQEVVIQPVATKEKNEPQAQSIVNHSLTKKINPFLKYDLLKIGMTIFVIVLLFIGLSIFSNSSNYLDQISQKLASFIHL